MRILPYDTPETLGLESGDVISVFSFQDGGSDVNITKVKGGTGSVGADGNQNTGSRAPSAGTGTPSAGTGTQAAGTGTQVVGTGTQAAGTETQAGTGAPAPRTGAPAPRTGAPAEGTRTLVATTGTQAMEQENPTFLSFILEGLEELNEGVLISLQCPEVWEVGRRFHLEHLAGTRTPSAVLEHRRRELEHLAGTKTPSAVLEHRRRELEHGRRELELNGGN